MGAKELRAEKEYHYAYQSVGRGLLLRKKIKDVLKHKKHTLYDTKFSIEGNVSTSFLENRGGHVRGN